jgi:sugar phosphate isomerase/epimerase
MSLPSRRVFLQTMAAGAVALPFLSRTAGAEPPHKFPGVLGLEMYTLRHLFDKDLTGTLQMVKDWGFADVEGGNWYGRSAADFKTLIAGYGLRMQSVLAGYEKLRDDAAGAIADAKAVGASYLGTAWIPHQGAFTRTHVDQAVADFTKWGKALKAEGLQFHYHVHGYEFQPSADGTLLDTLIKNTPPEVAFQMDVFWVMRGGGNPEKLLTAYPGRFQLMHLKDIAPGTALGDPTGSAPDETSVPLGKGQVSWASLLRIAPGAGVKMFYIEDEHPKAELQVPETLKFLATL